MEEIKIPESYYCPITHELMVDPVIDHEGNTYERKAIEEWLQKNPTSPFTKNPLKISDLHPNRALRDSIDLIRQYALKSEKLAQNSLNEEENENKKKKQQDDDHVPAPIIINSVPSCAETASGVKLTAEVDPTGLLLISVAPPLDGDRIPCDVCCVIDVSGSMGFDATLKSTTGDVESFGLSILDVVKHSVKTIIEVLGPNDRLSIVSFSDNAALEYALGEMTMDGKKIANQTLDNLKPTNSTNLWAGLRLGLDILKGGKISNRLSVLYLLTDGEPNIPPPRGELAMFQQYKNKEGLPCSVSTFGFGYKLNSILLNEIAVEGNGTYAFIPDSSLTGTVFVNALSNTLSTFANDLVISLDWKNPNGRIYGDFPIVNDREIHMGSLKYGQRKDVVIKLQENSSLNGIKLEYNRIQNGEKEICSLSQYSPTDLLEPTIHLYRLQLTELFKNIRLPPTEDEIKKFITEIQSSKVSKDPFIIDLIKDLSGQILEGLEPTAWARWGKHFLPSLCRAHLLQQCNNFKDPGVQHYGGKLFRSIRETAEELFIKLPPPQSTRKSVSYSISSTTTPVPKISTHLSTPIKYPKWTPKSPTKSLSKSPSKSPRTSKSKNTTTTTIAPAKTTTYAPVKMDNYYNYSGGCIGSEGKVLMQDNFIKKVKEIRKGDYVKLPNGESAQVLCVCKTTLNPTDKAPLVLLESGLIITPWHPVLLNNQWKFPCQIGENWNTTISSHDVFNFVLDKGHIMTVNGIACVTLGHGFTEEVVKHQYFGTEEVIHDLKSLPGWETGFIDLNHVLTRRDPQTSQVTGYLIN